MLYDINLLLLQHHHAPFGDAKEFVRWLCYQRMHGTTKVAFMKAPCETSINYRMHWYSWLVHRWVQAYHFAD